MDNTLSGPVDVLAAWANDTTCSLAEANQRATVYAAVAELIEALSFYTSICGNTCAMVSRETAAEMYAKGTAALTNVGGAK